jgi:hypothetical protein
MANGLFEQLTGVGEVGEQVPRVSSHNLVAVIGEVTRGEMTGPEATAALGLLPQTVTDITALIATVPGTNSLEEVKDVLDLVGDNKHYVTKAAMLTRFGI